MANTLRDDLRAICEKNGICDGPDREEILRRQREALVAVATARGELIVSLDPFTEMRWTGAEHTVDYIAKEGSIDSPTQTSVYKLTLPYDGGFGLTPKVVKSERLHRSIAEVEIITQLELVPATPLEYLDRIEVSRKIFGDSMEAHNVVKIQDTGDVSILCSQDTYTGIEEFTREDIISEFINDGWNFKRIECRTYLYHRSHNVLALDIEPRNCYMHNGKAQPFDLILCEPDFEMLYDLNL